MARPCFSHPITSFYIILRPLPRPFRAPSGFVVVLVAAVCAAARIVSIEQALHTHRPGFRKIFSMEIIATTLPGAVLLLAVALMMFLR